MNAEKDILERLSREMPSFSKRQRKIASFICENCDKAAFMTAEMLSEAAGVSESTVVRFAVELGYEGYPGLRKGLQMVLRERLDSSKNALSADEADSASEIFINAMNAGAEGMRRCLTETNLKSFKALAEKLCSASEIFIMGFDGMYPMAEYIEERLNAVREGICAVRDNHFAQLSRMDSSSLLILICGEKVNSLPLALGRFASERNAAAVLLCTGELHPALQYADSIIQAGSAAGIISIADAAAGALMAAENIKPEDKRAEEEKLRLEYMEDEK